MIISALIPKQIVREGALVIQYSFRLMWLVL